MPKYTFECMKCGTLFELEQDQPNAGNVRCADGSCGGRARLYPDRTSGILFVQDTGEPVPEGDSREEFVRFACAEALRTYSIDPKDVERGIIHASRRVGIDAAYLLVQGVMVRSDGEAERMVDVGDEATLELLLLQATREPEFNLTRLRMMRKAAQSFLSIEQPHSPALHEPGVLVQTFRWFHQLTLALAENNPTTIVRYYYISRGDSSQIGADVTSQAERIADMTRGFLMKPNEVTFQFMSERDLIT